MYAQAANAPDAPKGHQRVADGQRIVVQFKNSTKKNQDTTHTIPDAPKKIISADQTPQLKKPTVNADAPTSNPHPMEITVKQQRSYQATHVHNKTVQLMRSNNDIEGECRQEIFTPQVACNLQLHPSHVLQRPSLEQWGALVQARST